MNLIIDILLPTYKRAEALKTNLEHLRKEIISNDLSSYFRILISDNASPDDTQSVVAKIKEDYPVDILYFHQSVNIGLEANMVFILGEATAPFVLWTGDDDYVAKGYLSFCVKTITDKPDIGIIIPGLASLQADGSLIPGRPAAFSEKEFPAGFDTTWQLSHMAHQMSGLLMRREGLLDAYLSKSTCRNPYLFIQLSTYCLLKYGSVYAPSFPTAVTVFNEKDWGYNSIGLLDEVFKSYLFFQDQLTDEEVSDLMIRFSVLHSYRYAIKWNRPFRLMKQYRELTKAIPPLGTFRKKLALHLFKDYLKSFVKWN